MVEVGVVVEVVVVVGVEVEVGVVVVVEVGVGVEVVVVVGVEVEVVVGVVVEVEVEVVVVVGVEVEVVVGVVVGVEVEVVVVVGVEVEVGVGVEVVLTSSRGRINKMDNKKEVPKCEKCGIPYCSCPENSIPYIPKEECNGCTMGCCGCEKHRNIVAHQSCHLNEPKPEKDWWDSFRKCYDNNEAGGSSRWLVAPTTVEVMIKGFLSQQYEELEGEIEEMAKKHQKKFSSGPDLPNYLSIIQERRKRI